MDSGSDTWLIVLAAFGGGLFGAILQPVLTYGMDRMRAGDQRRKAIERNLRRMMTLWLEFTTRVGATAVEIASRRDLGRPALSDAEIMQRIRLAERPFPTWAAERIRDQTMRDLADALYEMAIKMPIRLIDPSTSNSELDSAAHEIGRLRHDIVIRMDELDWPEFEE